MIRPGTRIRTEVVPLIENEGTRTVGIIEGDVLPRDRAVYVWDGDVPRYSHIGPPRPTRDQCGGYMVLWRGRRVWVAEHEIVKEDQ